MGKTILLTRHAVGNQDVQSQLESHGFEMAVWESFRFEALPDLAADWLETSWDWLVFTSAASVRFFSDAVPQFPKTISVACVGDRTAKVARALGFDVQCVAEKKTALGLAKESVFQTQTSLNILLPQGQDARDEFFEALKDQHHIQKITVYQKQFLDMPKEIAQNVKAQKYDWILFFSPSVVKHILNFVNAQDLAKTKLAVIGETTEKAVLDLGLSCDVVAESSIEDLVQKLIKVC